MARRRYLRCALTISVVVILSSFAAGPIISKCYWGYWWAPPPRLAIVRSVRAIDSFAAVWPATTVRPQLENGIPSFREATRIAADRDPSFPLGRLPGQLAERGVSPLTNDASARPFLQPAIHTLRQHHLLAVGERGYPDAQRFDCAYLILVRTADHSRVLLLAMRGGQVSNDHYPYYEAAFAVSRSGGLRALEIHHFFFDVAGIEGATAREFAIAAAIPLTFIGMLAQGVLLVLTRRYAAGTFTLSKSTSSSPASL